MVSQAMNEPPGLARATSWANGSGGQYAGAQIRPAS